MISSKRLVLAPALALVLAGLSMTSAHATTDPLTPDALDALAVASCQLDPTAPLAAADVAPVVLGQTEVDVVPGEITAHLVRADVNTSAGDVRQCTFGVLHRDVLLPRVQYTGSVVLSLGDGLGGTAYSATTDVELGNMGIGSPVDPTAEVPLAGFLSPVDVNAPDPAYTITLDRKAIEVVQIAVGHADKAAANLLKKKLKAAALLEKHQLKAAAGKHSDKAAAAARRAHDKAVARAQAAYDRATSPKSVSRPVSHVYTVTGPIAAG